MATKSTSFILAGLLTIFLGGLFYTIFAPMIIEGVDDLNSTTKVQDCTTCQTLLEKIPLFTILGFFGFVGLGMLSLGFGVYTSVKS